MSTKERSDNPKGLLATEPTLTSATLKDLFIYFSLITGPPQNSVLTKIRSIQNRGGGGLIPCKVA